jgi:hypothetical protein
VHVSLLLSGGTPVFKFTWEQEELKVVWQTGVVSHMVIILAVKRLRQEDQEFKISLHTQPVQGQPQHIMKPHFRKQNKTSLVAKLTNLKG